MATIHLDGVSKAYGDNTVFSGLSLTVDHGECFTLLGPSGCGKTVLLRLIAGFETPNAGAIRIGGALVADASGESVPPDRRDLGVVFQEYAVWPHMTVFQNVSYPLKLAKASQAELTEKTLHAISLVNMAGLEKRLPSELSGGQQQRVALARALVARPSIMLLDEPLSNLDANLREEMRFEIKELQHKLDITVFYVTHDQEIALAISDRMAIMDLRGNIRQIGTPAEIYEKPADLFVFNFMGVANCIQVNRRGDVLCAGKGAQPVPWQAPPDDETVAEWVAGCRPSDVIIARPGAGGGNTLRGVIKRASFLGAMMDYLVEIDGAHLRTELPTHTAIAENLVFKDGEECAISFHNLHWFDARHMAEVTA
ncbi:ferric transporter subunit; ATP-binding component of ABC transporter; CP4-6 prophage [uncultured delta proteobacterium]|uniref:Ferric transporter subunit ATP-binding component of ABC transporter CP4-6 prophage n=1 Tax=uncultured delta proteobacterium TaxID=34034 RepID=A0A212JEJ4_9DELT|nr:ferric transporter subunit; ATP-binding component of ABC transporter; CP4-6 prophage [uncultured delta proteobacterium]